MNNSKAIIYLALMLVLLACLVGSLLFGKLERFSEAQQERQRIETEAREAKLAIEIEQKATLAPWTQAAKITGGALALLAIFGAILVVSAYGMRRALTISPTDGIFPLLLGWQRWRDQDGRRDSGWIFHDPNRVLGPGTVFSGGQFAYALPPGLEREQCAITAGALAVQATAARYQHPPTIAEDSRRNSATPLAAEDAPQLEPVLDWPAKVPLPSILNGPPSVERLTLCITVRPDTGERQVVRASMERLIHIAVGGSTGWGKSTFVQMLAYQLATAQEPVDLAMIDLKRLTFPIIAGSDRLLWPVATNEHDARAIFVELAGELQRRLELMERAHAPDMVQYNRANPGEALKPIAVLADECTYLLKDTAAQRSLHPLMLWGRAAGLWAIFAGQNWTTKFVPSEARDQFTSRFQFKTMNKSQSRMMLETGDAESIRDIGRAFALLPGQNIIELQAPIIDEADIRAALQGQTGPVNSMPTSEPDSGDVPDFTDDQIETILAMDAQDESLRSIATEIFGYPNGRRVTQIRAVLERDA